MRKIQSPLGIGEWPNYRDAVDPHAAEIAEFLAHYDLKPPFPPCGIAGCEGPHRDGYVIRLQDGSVTNVGSCCASKVDSFDEKLERWHRKMRRHEMTRRIADERERIARNRDTIAELTAIDSVLRARLRALGMYFPASYAALRQRFCNGDLLVHKGRSHSAADETVTCEPGRKRDAPLQPAAILGQLGGMSIFGPPASVRLAELSAFIDELGSISSLASLSHHRLAELELCIDFFDSQLAGARAQILDSEKFFSAHNFLLISQDETLPAKERRALQSYGRDAFMSGKFGDAASEAETHDAIECMKRALRRVAGDATRGAGARARSRSGVTRKLARSAKQ